MNPPAIEVSRVSKRYPNGVEALRDTALTVRQGEIFGLLGANGAGKSTLVKILLTLVRPTYFQGQVLGQPLGSRASKSRIGYLPEQVQFAEHLQAAELLRLAGRLHGIGGAKLTGEITRLLERVGLANWATQKTVNFSKGMRQRLGMAQALINNPDLIFLDEPTDGVDPMGRRDIRDLILELKKQGKTIFINSHLLSELEALCDRVAILQKGEVVRYGSVTELTQGGDHYLLTVEGELLDLPHLTQLVSALGGSISVPSCGGQTVISIPTRRPQVVQPIIDQLRAGGYSIISITPKRQSLEDYFLSTVSPPKLAESLLTLATTPPPVVPALDPHATMH